MDYEFIKDYKQQTDLRISFNELAGLVFGIDFEKWYRLGFWNERYKCYSFQKDEQVVSNISVNLMELIINGLRTDAIQIGTVMTHPDHRGKGLAEKLMSIVLSEYKKQSDLIFLFSNMSALGFYSRSGFTTIAETNFKAVIHIDDNNRHSIRKLDLSCAKDIDILRRLALDRILLSSAFGVDHAEGILAWHCLNVFPQDIFYFDTLDTIIIFKSEGSKIDLYDMISTDRQNLCEALSACVPAGEYEVTFHFTPDFENIDIIKKQHKTDDYEFYVMSEAVRLPEEFFFPYTAHA